MNKIYLLLDIYFPVTASRRKHRDESFENRSYFGDRSILSFSDKYTPRFQIVRRFLDRFLSPLQFLASPIL